MKHLLQVLSAFSPSQALTQRQRQRSSLRFPPSNRLENTVLTNFSRSYWNIGPNMAKLFTQPAVMMVVTNKY